jgi:hypothetical protein
MQRIHAILLFKFLLSTVSMISFLGTILKNQQKEADFIICFIYSICHVDINADRPVIEKGSNQV